MSIKFPPFIFTLLLLLGLSSCVSKKKYYSLEKELLKEKMSNSQLDKKNEELQLLKEKISANFDSYQTKTSKELANLESQLSLQSEEIENKDEALAARAKRLMALEAQFQQQQEAVNRLKATMAAALVNFETEDLSVEVRNGKVYISLSDKLLFPSASANLNKEGQDAIGKVAEVLKKNKDINIEIIGHTDTKPIRIKYKDNWELSTARSLTIARLFTEEYAIEGKRIIASGAGQYRPVANNETEEGRSLNRRTEIILSPNLDKLMDLLDDAPKN